jgi:hypothetical protein
MLAPTLMLTILTKGRAFELFCSEGRCGTMALRASIRCLAGHPDPLLAAIMRAVQRGEAGGAGTFLSSQSTITCAIASLFFSIIIMWPLPRRPMSASFT